MIESRLPLPARTSRKNSWDRVAFAVYLFVSLFATFLNKRIVTHSEFKFPFPLCFTFLQLVIVEIALNAWQWIGRKSHISSFSWNVTTARRVVPITAVYMLVLVISPQFLKRVEPTMYQAMRSLVIPLSIFLTHYALRQQVHSSLKVASGILCFGIWLASFNKLSLSLESVFYGCLWAFVIALYGIAIKRTLTVCNFHIWPIIQYNTAMSIVAVAGLIILSGEWKEMLLHDTVWDKTGFWTDLLASTAMDAGVQVSMLILIKHTSPLTHAVASTTKTCLQVIVAFLLFHNPVSIMNICGLCIALTGTAWFYFHAFLKQ